MRGNKINRGGLLIKQLILVIVVAAITVLSACAESDFGLSPAQPVAGGDPKRGQQAVRAYGCHSCHTIPGIPGANSLVGPPLTAWAERHYISGKLPNTPDNLIQWIQFPQAIEPGTAMPNMGVTEQDARDISAFLYTLQGNDN